MTWLKRKRLLRQVLVAAVVLGGALTWLVWSRRGERYVPGQGAEGLFDSLGRQIPEDRPAFAFRDVTTQAGIAFRHFPATRANKLPEDMGSGVALGDFDGDGWTDVFLVNTCCDLAHASTPPGEVGRCALYRNRGNGTFDDVSRAAGVDLALMGMGAAFVDADSDGDLDLVVTSYGGLKLLCNNGSGRFDDVTAASGLAEHEGFWTGVTAGDYDRDGALDLYVCGYVHYRDEHTDRRESQYGVDIPTSINPSAYEPERNLLLHNLGNLRFEEVAARHGVDNRAGRSLSATFADLSGDGWPDLYVANDVSDNAYFESRGDGTFEDRTAPAQIGDYRGAMGLAVTDFDGDLDFDFLVTHWLAQENALYVNMARVAGGRGEPIAATFVDMADRYGLGQPALDKVGWATRFFDLDNDGALDLFVVNGSTVPTKADQSRLAPQKSQLFWNAGGKRGYFELGALAGEFFGAEHVGRGGATFDYDLDGDEDLLVTVHGASPHLLANEGGNARACVRLRLRQPSGNRFAIGALVEARIGERTFVDQLDSQGSYLSQHAVGELAIGLGSTRPIDELAVTWPDGARETCGPLPADTLVTWTRGSPPDVALLPGKRTAALAGPKSVETQREFYALLDATTEQRVAGQIELAVQGYLRALELWPSHEDLLYNLGNCYVELGRADEALAQYRALVMFHPESNRGWMQIGNLILARPQVGAADLELAAAAFERSHAINKEESLPVVRMGLVALLRGDLARADELFAAASVLNSASVEARYFRGRVAWLRGERERAGALLAEAHEVAKKKPVTAVKVSHEGDTQSGTALTASAAQRVSAPLERWKTLSERPPDPELEYAAPR